MKKTVVKKSSRDVNVNAKSVVDRLLGEDNVKPAPKKKVAAKKKPAK